MSHIPFIPRAATRVISVAAVLWVVSLVVTGCASSAPVTYVAEDRSYGQQQVLDLARSADVSKASGIDVAEAPAARTRALVALRREGDDGGRLADLLTKGFPMTARSVPVYAEDARVDGTPAWIVVEAWGDEGGKLVHKRLWVFAKDDGRLLQSASFK